MSLIGFQEIKKPDPGTSIQVRSLISRTFIHGHSLPELARAHPVRFSLVAELRPSADRGLT